MAGVSNVAELVSTELSMPRGLVSIFKGERAADQGFWVAKRGAKSSRRQQLEYRLTNSPAVN